jgi:hypothetical protein
LGRSGPGAAVASAGGGKSGPTFGPGDLVQIRSKAEILATLDSKRKNRGLSFDADMAMNCGKVARVLRRVERLVDEKSGVMLHLKNDCLILEGVLCRGLDCRHRLFCPRGALTFWRSAWLRPAPAEPDRADPSPPPDPH